MNNNPWCFSIVFFFPHSVESQPKHTKTKVPHLTDYALLAEGFPKSGSEPVVATDRLVGYKMRAPKPFVSGWVKYFLSLHPEMGDEKNNFN